jgi:hypothetical protein
MFPVNAELRSFRWKTTVEGPAADTRSTLSKSVDRSESG